MLVRVALVAASLCLGGAARAGDKPLYAPTPAWVKPTPAIDATKLTDADPIMMLLDQQQRIGNGDGEIWAYGEMAVRMASPQVLSQSGTLPLAWDPAKGDLIVHGVEILRGSERIDVLAGGKRFEVLQREQQMENAAFTGILTATLPIEGLRVGDLIHVRFSMTRKDPALHGHVQAMAMLLAEPMQLRFGRVRLLWPKTLDLRWRAHLKTAELQAVNTADGFREIVLAMPVAKPPEMPSDAPQRYQPLPLLEATDYADWQAVSKDMARLYRSEGAIAPGGPLAAEVARIAAATVEPRQRAALALQLVQDKVRYLFRGMENGNYIPQSPAHTWSVRYGDCKAKSLLLLALLSTLGIEAEAVLVNSEAGDWVPARLPMPGAFNHVIVRATIGGETLWLDGTGGGSRLADLGDVPPFRHALPLRESGADLVAMPAKPNARPITDVRIDLDATAGALFPMPYKAEATLRGQDAEMLRVVAAQGGKEALHERIDSLLKSHLNLGEVVARTFQYDEASATGVISAAGLSYPGWKRDRGRYKLSLDATVEAIDFKPDRARPAWREIPVTSGAYADARVRTRIRLPGGGAGFETEGNRTLPATLAGVTLQRAVAQEGGVLTIDDRWVTGIGEVAPADIPATRAQVSQAKARLLKAVAPKDHPPLFRQIEAARRAKAFEPILAIYAKQISEKPDEVAGYTDRAWFLSRIYDRPATIRDLTKALALEPTVDTHLWRSRLYSDLKDDAGAMVDARAALALDPGSSSAVILVASLLADAGKRDEALAMVAERADQGGDEKNGYVEAQADLLAKAGRVDEALALLDGIVDASPGKANLLNSRCWLKGTRNVALDTALKDCTRAIELSNSPAAALDSRAMVYFRMNRLDEAMADLEAALEEQPDQAGSLFLRGVIRKRTGAAGADADLTAARLIAPLSDQQFAEYGIKP